MAKRRSHDNDNSATKTNIIDNISKVEAKPVVDSSAVDNTAVESENTKVFETEVYKKSTPPKASFYEETAVIEPLKEKDPYSFFDLKVLEENVANCLQIVDDHVMKSYVTKLSELPVIEPEFDEKKFRDEPYQWFHITKLVYEKEEFSVSKLATVFQVATGKNCTIVLMIQNKNHRTNFYLGVRNHDEKDFTGTLRQMLETSLKGQFPGSDFDDHFDHNSMDKIKEELKESTGSVSSVTCIPDFKQKKDFFENKDFQQGLEKFVLSMQNKDYTAVFIADAVPYDDLSSYRAELESIYTQLAPFANIQYQVNKSKSSSSSESTNDNTSKSETTGKSSSETSSESSSIGKSKTTTDGTSSSKGHTTNKSDTDTKSKTNSVNDTKSNSTTDTKGSSNTFNVGAGISSGINSAHTESRGTSTSKGSSRSMGDIMESGGAIVGAAIGSVIPIPGAGAVIGGKIGGTIGKVVGSLVGNRSKSNGTSQSSADTIGNYSGLGLNAGYAHGTSTSHAETQGESHSVGISDTISKALTKGISDSVSNGKNHSETDGTSNTSTTGKSIQYGQNSSYSKTFSFGHAETLSDTLGSSQGVTIQSNNFMISNMLERIKKQITRIDECESIGMWSCSAYFMSETRDISETAASTYRSLISGTNSGVERSAVNTWGKNSEQLPIIKDYVTHFRHPVFMYPLADNESCSIISPAALISTNELAIQMSLPRKSICGLPVAEHAVFGQEVITNYKARRDSDENKTFNMGKIYHLNKTTDSSVDLDLNSMTMHTFVTGSTGSGKSNAVYHILDKLTDKKIPYLVIEPAKGEYKTKFKNANIFGTNPNINSLLRLNPFSFPVGKVHIQEHIDRLVEIFNVCWPMYAAMPAVLKDSVIRAYESIGWDMNESVNKENKNLFPTFKDVLSEIDEVVRDADYSGDTSSDYKGALKTRLKSLTNGINGMVFSNIDIPSEMIFDTPAIVDLSRVGSSETKSLIMGILVLKLQEHRMSHQTGTDSDLKHVTVIEEAHNLLKKTSTEQGQETANLQGKSVEMITNSIAEMRTYGEGFIIADQAPDLLDTAVIRNTNTKIVLRLPEGKDREIVGKSMALKDDQIQELSKLTTGVAAIYQNNWQEAVLCDIPLFKPFNPFAEKNKISEKNILKKFLNHDITAKTFIEDIEREYEEDACKEYEANIREEYRKAVSEKYNLTAAECLFNKFECFKILNGTSSVESTDEMIQIMMKNINNSEFSDFTKEEKEKICYYIFRNLHEMSPDNKLIKSAINRYVNEGELLEC